ncbi:MAG: hypothetical protein K0S26_2992 [Bacteroidota bacterium]|jgi:hypothetical protein|nr:hypothetical protein [Bacteroidota bacterium]
MSNLFLINEAIDTNDYSQFLEGMSELNFIERGDDDNFFRHDSFWKIDILNTLYSNYGGLQEAAVVKFIDGLSHHSTYLNTHALIDSTFPDELNAFLGFDFSKTAIHPDKQISNNEQFKILLHNDLWNVSFRSLWGKRKKLFPNLILCGDVKNQISMIGASGYFNQIIDRLKEFNDAVAEWQTGDFSYKQINQNYSLRISPESSKTMDSYGNQRIFSLPKGGTQTFDLHIKTGDLRFHFYPDNQTREVYIGYIGSHLDTVSN